MDKQILIEALTKADQARPRSLQTAIGVSQLGGCRAQVWHKLNGTAETNPNTYRLAAIMGTAIHASIEQALTGSKFLLEHRVEVDGFPPATIDCFDPATGTVTDFKTITKKNAAYFGSKQQRWQVQVYGFLMAQSGYEVNTVQLLGIPRDGDERDVIDWNEPYNESVAREALAWLDDVKALTEPPAPEKPETFCKSYCAFYGACSGITKDLSGQPITDDLATQAASDYVAVSAEIKELEARKDAAKTYLEGVDGVTFDGIKVSWSEIRGRETPDLDAIKSALGSVPVKIGMPTMRLTVK